LEACRLFNIDRKTIYNWLRRPSLSPSPAKTRHRLLDKEAVSAHVKTYPDALLRERAAHFGVSVSGMWRCLKRMSIVKKNNVDILK